MITLFILVLSFIHKLSFRQVKSVLFCKASVSLTSSGTSIPHPVKSGLERGTPLPEEPFTDIYIPDTKKGRKDSNYADCCRLEGFPPTNARATMIKKDCLSKTKNYRFKCDLIGTLVQTYFILTQ